MPEYTVVLVRGDERIVISRHRSLRQAQRVERRLARDPQRGNLVTSHVEGPDGPIPPEGTA